MNDWASRGLNRCQSLTFSEFSIDIFFDRELMKFNASNELNAISKGVAIGIMPASANRQVASNDQPYIDLMGRKVRVVLTSLRRSIINVNGRTHVRFLYSN